LFRREYVLDGNFKAEHMKMRKSADEIIITDGTGFFSTEKRYKEHLKVAKEYKEVC
jgi:hypothetical protein